MRPCASSVLPSIYSQIEVQWFGIAAQRHGYHALRTHHPIYVLRVCHVVLPQSFAHALSTGRRSMRLPVVEGQRSGQLPELRRKLLWEGGTSGS